MSIADEAVAGPAEGRGEELPGQQAREHDERVGHVAGWHLGELAENKREQNRLDRRLDHRPSDTEDRLFVTDLDVAPREEAG